jgi:hypothetical protein
MLHHSNTPLLRCPRNVTIEVSHRRPYTLPSFLSAA